MAYELEELSLELIDALVPLMPRIKQRDKALEDASLARHNCRRRRHGSLVLAAFIARRAAKRR